MNIALVHCPFDHRLFSENLKVVDEEFCVAPPLVLAYVAAIIEKAGHTVCIIDANALRLTSTEALVRLKAFHPDMIGFRIDTYWVLRAVEWATFFKQHLTVPILVGGVNVTLYPHETFSHRCFDFGVQGEANISLPAFLHAYEHKKSYQSIPGLIYRDRQQLVVNPPVSTAVPLDEYPFPARGLLPNHAYYSFTSQRRNFTIMITSTGCPFKCTFCAIAPLPLRERSPENVLQEIDHCYHTFGVREIDFFDPVFFINKKRNRAICEGIIQRQLDLEWSCRSRVDMVDDESLALAARAGCRKIYFGIESAEASVLTAIKKETSYADVQRAIGLSRDHGIRSLGFFMVGNPEDTSQSVKQSIQMAKKLKLDFVLVCRTVPKPGTPLNELLIQTTGVDYWREYILGLRQEQRFPTPWTRLSEKEKEKLVWRFYVQFYFRFLYILRRLRGLRSAEELRRYVRAAAKWFLYNTSDVKSPAASPLPRRTRSPKAVKQQIHDS